MSELQNQKHKKTQELSFINYLAATLYENRKSNIYSFNSYYSSF